jgi:hypothetical protein
MRRALSFLPATLVISALLAACSSSGIPKHDDPQSQQRDRYASYAGPPQDSFTWLGRYDSWQSIGNNQLVIYTTPFDAYLITVASPCNDLPWVNTIGITSTTSTVSARFDSIKVKRTLCQITEIRKVDINKMKADMRAESEKAKAAAAAPK